MKINPNYLEINAANQLNDPKSVFNYYRQLIKIRHDIPTLTYGNYVDLDTKNDSIYAYTRNLGSEKYLIIVNFKEKTMRYTLPNNLSINTTIIENNAKNSTKKNDTLLVLEPWQSGIYKLN
ncbi:alpha-glucosidase C-terminal domain-containing protein [Serratia symbiotica]|uniref:alpha-glucosidase C-terminal domain-containing protein n=1 Tax=Serratia symbiotica TaxID=138074 RepID=UPI00030E6414